MSQKRCYSLDALKVFATILIVFHHYQQMTGAYFEHGINYFGGKFYFGYIVELFFVLSGYFMFKYIERIKNGLHFKQFYLARMQRLLPLVMISAICYEILLICYEKVFQQTYFDIKPTLWGTIIDSLGVQTGWVFAEPFVNAPTWYISVLFLCYATFYLVTFLSQKLHISSRYLYVAMILLGCSINTFGINLPFFNNQSSRGFYSFFAGILLSTYFYEKKTSWKECLISFLVSVFLIFCIVFHYDFVENGLVYLLTFCLYPSIIILFQSPIISNLFSSRFWGKWGEFSFDVYIWHNLLFIAMFLILRFLNRTPDFNKHSNMYLFCLIAEIVGLFSYLLIERPVNKYISRQKEVK